MGLSLEPSKKRRIYEKPHLMLTTAFQAGVAHLARASAFQAEGCGFETRFPLHFLSSKGREPLQYDSLNNSIELFIHQG